MRRSLIVVLTLAVPVAGETIGLKNGRKIFADTVRENGMRVEYTVGEDTYAISKSSVQRIDTGGSPVVTRSEPAPEVKVGLGPLTIDSDLESRLNKDGKLDTDLLASVTREGPPERSAGANVFVGMHYRSTGKLHDPLRYFTHAC